MQNALNLDKEQLAAKAISLSSIVFSLMGQVKLIVITIVTVLTGIVNLSQQQVNASKVNETVADEQNPDNDFDVPQLPIGKVIEDESLLPSILAGNSSNSSSSNNSNNNQGHK